MRTPSRRRFLVALGAGVAPVAGGTVASQVDAAGAEDASWHRNYGGSEYQVQAVTRAHDGGVLLVGRTGSSNRDQVWLAAIRPNGESAWTTTLDARGFPRLADVAITPDGYLLAGIAGDGGATPWVVGTDTAGTRTWEWFGDAHGALRHVNRLGTQYAITGFRGEPARTDTSVTGWLRVVEPDGSLVWERTLPARYTGGVTRFDGGIAVVGDVVDSPDADADAWWAALDESGETTRESRHGGVGDETAQRVVAVGAGLLVGGRTDSPAGVESNAGFLMRTDGEGTPVWRRTYDIQYFAGLQHTQTGFAFTGEPPDTDHGRDPAKPLVLVDRWGRVTTRVTVSVSAGWPVGLARFADGGYALAGASDSGPWVARFDLQG